MSYCFNQNKDWRYTMVQTNASGNILGKNETLSMALDPFCFNAHCFSYLHIKKDVVKKLFTNYLKQHR